MHLYKVLQQGPADLWQNAAGWWKHGKFLLKQRSERYLNAPPPVVDVTQPLSGIEMYVKVEQTHLQAMSKYLFQVYPGKITLLRTSDQTRSHDAVGMQYDPQLGWGDISTGGLEIHHISGPHMYLLEKPHVKGLAEKLQSCLEKAVCNYQLLR